MSFWSKKADTRRLRIFFATDVHGSEPTFRKFLNAGKFYNVDVLILGGDITGKMLIPIISTGNQQYRATVQSISNVLHEGQIQEFETRLAKLGFYSSVMSEDEYRHLREWPAEVEKLYYEKASQRLTSWIRLAEERLAGTHILCYITGGNDDPVQIVDVLQQEARERVVACEGMIAQLDDAGHTMISLGFSNPTPWKTPREIDDSQLAEKILKSVEGIDDFSKVIFNLHAPPINSTLDTCPMLDDSTDPPTVITSGGEPVMYGAGSQAVMDAINRYQPLLSLHGHIHESRGNIKIGRTTAVNPGSEYGEGILRGAIINLIGDQVESVQLTSG